MKWKDGPDGVSTWIQFGPFQLQGVRADFEEGDSISAAIQLVDSDGNTIAEQEVDGDPSLAELRMFAKPFVMSWVGQLKTALDQLPWRDDE